MNTTREASESAAGEDEAAVVRRQALGCLLGGAVGDAIGEPIEFMDLHQIRTVVGPEGVTGFWDRAASPGAFSDDTQMTLWTAEGLIRACHASRGLDSWDPVGATTESYMRWWLTQEGTYEADHGSIRTGWLIEERGLWRRMAPGNTCLSALRMGGNTDSGTSINDSKGCGGVMRVAPVAFISHGEKTYPYELGKALARITHGHPTGYIAAGVFAQVINGLRRGVDLGMAIEEALILAESDPGSSETVRAVRAAVTLAEKGNGGAFAVESLGRGWVAEEALAIALYCSLIADDFRTGVLLSVNHSGDSDSTGSMTGQLLGTMLGVDCIAPEWLERLQLREVVERVGNDLVDALFTDRDLPDDRYPA